MGTTREYNPKEISLIVGLTNHLVSGFHEGAFLSIEYDVDNFKDLVGADGEGVRVNTNNFAAKITITLLQTSLSNSVLSILSNADRKLGKSAFPLTMKDNLGSTVNFAAQVWVMKMPTQSYDTTPSPRVWVLRTLQLDAFVGSNRVVGS